MSKVVLMILLSFVVSVSNATRLSQNIHEQVSIAPKKSFIVTILTNKPIHVGWNVPGSDCIDNCVEATNITESLTGFTLSAQFGATSEYSPVDGKVTIKYKNIRKTPVVITVFTEQQICDSMACDYLKSKGINNLYDINEVKSDWKRIISKKIYSFDSSDDGSYSTVLGESVFGTKYEITIIWWLVDQDTPSFCIKWIPTNGSYTPDKKQVYQFSGSYTSVPVHGIMYGVGCSFMPIKDRGKNDL